MPSTVSLTEGYYVYIFSRTVTGQNLGVRVACLARVSTNQWPLSNVFVFLTG